MEKLNLRDLRNQEDQPESQWRQLLRDSGIKSDTEIIVISGEEPQGQSSRKLATRPLPAGGGSAR